MDRQILGIDIGGTNLRSGYVGDTYQLSDFRISPSQAIQGKHAIENLTRYIQAVLAEAEHAPLAVSIGFPSTIDKARKRLLSTPNLEGLDNLEVVESLEQALGLPVFIDRDVNLHFLYDCHVQDLHGDVMVGFYIGTGFGNAIAIHGEILIGKNGVAAELGHIPMRGVEACCRCGNVGCVETVASGKALEEIREKHYPDEPISEIFQKHAHDTIILAFIQDLALPIATEVNILDPDAVILGGGVLQMPGFPKENLEHAIRAYVRKPYPERALHFCYSVEKQENGVIGAGIRAFKALDKQGRSHRHDCAGL